MDVVVLNDAPPLLGRRVVTQGRRLLCRDEAAGFAYVRDVQLRAADLEPWLRRMREVKLRAIRRMSPLVDRRGDRYEDYTQAERLA